MSFKKKRTKMAIKTVFFGIVLPLLYAVGYAIHEGNTLQNNTNVSSFASVRSVTGVFEHPIRVGIFPFYFRDAIEDVVEYPASHVLELQNTIQQNMKDFPPPVILSKLFDDEQGLISVPFREISFGKISFTSTAFDYYELNVPLSSLKGDDDGFISKYHKKAIQDVLQGAGKNESDFDLIISMANLPNYYRGHAISPKPGETRYAELTIGMLTNNYTKYFDCQKSITHEIGHTFGFTHSAVNATLNDLIKIEVLHERRQRKTLNLFHDYGDFFSTMGGYLTLNGKPLLKRDYFTAHQRAMAGWLDLDQALPIIPQSSTMTLDISNLATTQSSPEHKVFGCRIQVDFQPDPVKGFSRDQVKQHRFQLHIEMQNDPEENPAIVIRAVSEDFSSFYDNPDFDTLSLFVDSLHKENDSFTYQLDPSFSGFIKITLKSIEKENAVLQIQT